MHPCAYLRLRTRAGAQRRSIRLRSLRRTGLQARQYSRNAHAQARGLAADAKIRAGQARYADASVSALRSQAIVQRRLSEGSVCSFARRRLRAELPLPRSGTILQTYASRDANDGKLA